jgi:hypothetical protein
MNRKRSFEEEDRDLRSVRTGHRPVPTQPVPAQPAEVLGVRSISQELKANS